MEILFITHKYPPSVGGMEKQSLELIRGMSAYSKVYTIAHSKGSKLIFFLFLPFKICFLLYREPKISIIHLNDGTMAAFCWWIKWITNIPVCVTYHGLDVVFPNLIYQKYILERVKKFDGFIVVSRSTAEELIRRGFSKNKVTVINNGIDHEIADIPKKPTFLSEIEERHHLKLKDKKILISLGRPVKRKGFSWFIKNVLTRLPNDYIFIWIGQFSPKVGIKEYLLQIFPKIMRHQIELLLGKASDESELRICAQLPEFRNRLIVPGKLNYDVLWQYLSIADLFVMPNVKVTGDMEGFGLVNLEANMRELPVLASDLEGIRDAVIPEKNGWLLPPNDADIWTETIQSIFKNPAALKSMGERAKEFAIANFSWVGMIGAYNRLFMRLSGATGSLIKNGGQRPPFNLKSN